MEFDYLSRVFVQSLKLGLAVDPFLDTAKRHGSDSIVDHLSILEQKRMGDTSHAVVCGKFWLTIRVDENHLEGVFGLGVLGQCRIERTARTAPLGTELDDDWAWLIRDFGFKKGVDRRLDSAFITFARLLNLSCKQ